MFEIKFSDINSGVEFTGLHNFLEIWSIGHLNGIYKNDEVNS